MSRLAELRAAAARCAIPPAAPTPPVASRDNEHGEAVVKEEWDDGPGSASVSDGDDGVHSEDNVDGDDGADAFSDADDTGPSGHGDSSPPFFASADTDEASAAKLTAALLDDLKSTQANEESPAVAAEPASKATDCCVCGTRALYTCPGCGRRTCSIICVRVHKEDFHCTGVRDVAAKVPLNAFTDQQLQRDYHFLENCRRVVDNVERCFPRTMWRYNYRALPPPLHALREAARRRGVICQITSEGMRKRDVNTSRLDRKTNTIVWHCEFHFASDTEGDADTVVATDWGSERHRLGDVLKYCWAKNPPLPCYHINRQYNRASTYVGAAAPTNATATATTAEQSGDAADCAAEATQPVGVTAPSQEGEEEAVADAHAASHTETPSPSAVVAAPEEPYQALTPDDPTAVGTAEDNGADAAVSAELVPLHAYEEVAPVPLIEPGSAQEVQLHLFVQSFLSAKYVILSRAERLGNEARYFLLDPYDTVNENMRRLFFVNEFPVFLVVHASQLHRYPLVTDENREAIRNSFRSRKTQEPRERVPMRRRSEMAPEEAERLSRVPCRRFLQARCLLGDECPYWHCTPEEIPVCRTYLRMGQCDKGARCSFRHDAEAVRVARKRLRDGVGEDGSPLRGRGRGFSRGRGWGRGRGGGSGGGGFRGGAPYGARRRFE